MNTRAQKISKERTEKKRTAKVLDMTVFQKEIRKSLKKAAKAGQIKKVL